MGRRLMEPEAAAVEVVVIQRQVLVGQEAKGLLVGQVHLIAVAALMLLGQAGVAVPGVLGSPA